MAKDSRFKYEYRKNASKLHKAVGGLLRNHPTFKHKPSFQEYPVNKVNPKYPNGSHKFDWVIPQLKLVIECHGIQHYECQTFGADVVDAIDSFVEIKRRDEQKKEAALNAGWLYVVIAYNEPITANLLLAKIQVAREELATYEFETWEDLSEIPPYSHGQFGRIKKQRDKEKRQKHLASDQHKQRLAKAKEYRKSRYKIMKELKDGKI